MRHPTCSDVSKKTDSTAVKAELHVLIILRLDNELTCEHQRSFLGTIMREGNNSDLEPEKTKSDKSTTAILVPQFSLN